MRETKINFVKKTDAENQRPVKTQSDFRYEERQQKKTIGNKVAKLMEKEGITMEAAISKIMSFNDRQSKKFSDKPRFGGSKPFQSRQDGERPRSFDREKSQDGKFGDRKPRFEKKLEEGSTGEKRQDSRFGDKPRRSFDEKKKLNIGNRNHNRDNHMLSELQRKIEILKNAGKLD
jgi:hypothetical protein